MFFDEGRELASGLVQAVLVVGDGVGAEDGVGCGGAAATGSWRVPCSENTSADTRRRAPKSMWTKSKDKTPGACSVRNSRQVGPLRRAAGSSDAAGRISHTVVVPMVFPT